MKILYSCQGSSLNLFSKINQEFKKDNKISKAGFIVSNESFYKNNFLKQNFSFEKNNLVLKEWELFNKFKKNPFKYNLKILKKFENSLEDNCNLIDAVVADRRVFCGKDSSFFQDYERRYDDNELYSLIYNYYAEINKFIIKFKPKIFVNFLPVTLFDYLAYLICKKKKIRIFTLRSTKIKNYVYFSESFFDPSPELVQRYNLLRKKKNKKSANNILKELRKKNFLYEGVVKLSNKPALNIKFDNYLNFFKNFYFNLKNNFFSQDPQSINVLKSYFYNSFYNKLNSNLSNQLISSNFEKTKKIIKEKNFKLAFFPMHTEPEVSLLCYSKPYLNQIEIIRQIAISLPIDYVLLVKEHPWSVGKRKLTYYKKILNIPRVYFVPHNFVSVECVDMSNLVFTLSGSIGQEAVFLKKPVITFGNTNINILPKTKVLKVSNLTNLNANIKEILKNYKYSKNEVLSYIQANIDISVNVNLYTSLLEKKNAAEYKNTNKDDDFSIISNYLRTLIKKN
jgi:hypothetical protein